MGRGRFVRRFSLASLVAAAGLIATNATNASPAEASVTIGQLAPEASPPAVCVNPDPYDEVQPTVTSGKSYVVPTGGVVTSWSHKAAAGSGQKLTMKIFREVGDPNVYQVVGHDGPRRLAARTVNTFSASIPVRAGDVLGLNDTKTANACAFSSPGEAFRWRLGDLADGASGPFAPVGLLRLNITAVVKAAACKRKPASIVGSDGADKLTGTPAADVIAAFAGNDKVSGLAGNDVICGGSGKDTLTGGGGEDTLLGEKGKDKLKGGGGKDLCKGGKGNDFASACEVKKSI
jgi:hypothetical protein